MPAISGLFLYLATKRIQNSVISLRMIATDCERRLYHEPYCWKAHNYCRKCSRPRPHRCTEKRYWQLRWQDMFTSDRYMTRGVNNTVPLAIQLTMWGLIERLPVPADYLQVFRLTGADGRQIITHEQEEPVYCRTISFPCSEPISCKIFVIDDGEHSTMMLADEYWNTIFHERIWFMGYFCLWKDDMIWAIPVTTADVWSTPMMYIQ